MGLVGVAPYVVVLSCCIVCRYGCRQKKIKIKKIKKSVMGEYKKKERQGNERCESGAER